MARGPHEARDPMQPHRRQASPVKQSWSLQFKNKNIDRISDKSRILCESWQGEHSHNATGKHVQCTTVFLNVFQHAAHFWGQNFWRLTVLRQTIEFANALKKRNIFVIVTFKSQNNFFPDRTRKCSSLKCYTLILNTCSPFVLQHFWLFLPPAWNSFADHRLRKLNCRTFVPEFLTKSQIPMEHFVLPPYRESSLRVESWF